MSCVCWSEEIIIAERDTTYRCPRHLAGSWNLVSTHDHGAIKEHPPPFPPICKSTGGLIVLLGTCLLIIPVTESGLSDERPFAALADIPKPLLHRRHAFRRLD